MSVASLAGYLANGGGGGGNVNGIIQGAGINVIDQGNGEYEIENNGVISTTNGVGINSVLSMDTGNLTITNTGVTSIVQGAGININNNTGDVTISSTVNPDDYVSQTEAAATYQTQAAMTDYLTTTTAGTTYQTQAGMSNYLTTATAGTTYQPIGNYLSSSTSSQMFTYIYEPQNIVTIAPNEEKNLNILPVPSIPYVNGQIYVCIVQPLYNNAYCSPITMRQCEWIANGSAQVGEILFGVYNSSDKDIKMTSFICYGFRNINT